MAGELEEGGPRDGMKRRQSPRGGMGLLGELMPLLVLVAQFNVKLCLFMPVLTDRSVSGMIS